MASEPITDEQILLCTEGEVCVTEHEPKFGVCNYCSKIKACTATKHLACGDQMYNFTAGVVCRGAIVLYPYIQQPELQAAFRLGGLAAVEAIVRPKAW